MSCETVSKKWTICDEKLYQACIKQAESIKSKKKRIYGPFGLNKQSGYFQLLIAFDLSKCVFPDNLNQYQVSREAMIEWICKTYVNWPVPPLDSLQRTGGMRGLYRC